MKMISLLLLAFLFSSSAHRYSATPTSSASGPIRISLETGNASGAYLTTDHRGYPVLSWVQQVGSDAHLLYYAVSADGGCTFATPKVVPTSKGIYPHDENLSKVIYKKNGDLLAVFGVNNPNPDNRYAGMLYYTQSFNAGKTWTTPKQLSPAKSYSIDERYFDVTLLTDGEIGVVWLDSRKESHGHHHEGSSLFFSRTEGRKGFTEEKRIAESTCQCCRTKLYQDQAGQLHVTYRAIINDSIRDMVHTASLDNGKSFSKPSRISPDNWIIKGCPHTGPTMTGNKVGTHFAWYTLGNGEGIFYCHSLKDGTFSPRENISASASAKHPQITTTKDGSLAIVWDERASEGTTFRVGLQTRTPEGKSIQQAFITPEAASSTHPVIMATAPTGLLVAYTQKNGDRKEVYYERRD